jgi:hypothetical protein
MSPFAKTLYVNPAEHNCSRRREGLMRRKRREAVLVALVTVSTLDA